jgi:hypothetical protein
LRPFKISRIPTKYPTTAPTAAKTTTTSSNNSAVIAGASAGGVILFLLIGLCCFVVCKRQQKQNKPQDDLEIVAEKQASFPIVSTMKDDDDSEDEARAATSAMDRVLASYGQRVAITTPYMTAAAGEMDSNSSVGSSCASDSEATLAMEQISVGMSDDAAPENTAPATSNILTTSTTAATTTTTPWMSTLNPFRRKQDDALNTSRQETLGGNTTDEYDMDQDWNPDDNSMNSPPSVDDFLPSPRPLIDHNNTRKQQSFQMDPVLTMDASTDTTTSRLRGGTTPRAYARTGAVEQAAPPRRSPSRRRADSDPMDAADLPPRHPQKVVEEMEV